MVLLHAWAWLEKLFLGPEAGQQARKEKKLFRPQKVLFSIARGLSAGKEGKETFQAPKSFIFYRQRPVSRQGRKKNFSGPKKFYFLLPEAGQQARKEKKTFQAPKSFIFYRQRPVSRQGRKKNFSGPKKFYFLLPEAGQQARKEKKLFRKEGKKLFRPQKVLFSIARGRSAGKEGKKKIRPQKVLFSIARGPLRGLTAAEAVGFRVAPEEHCISAIMSEMSPPKRKKRKDRSDSDLKIPARDRGSWKKTFRKLKSFFPWGWTLERRPTSYFLPSN